MRKYVSVGILVDEHCVRFAFSPWCFEDEVPVPVTIVSPVLEWRHGPVISQATSTALCLMPTLIIQRLPIKDDRGAAAFGGHTREKAMKLEGESVQLPLSRQGVPYNLIVEMEELKAEVAILKQGACMGFPCAPLLCASPRRWSASTPTRGSRKRDWAEI